MLSLTQPGKTMPNRNGAKDTRCQAQRIRGWCLSALLLVTPAALLADDFLYEIRDSVLYITGYTGPGGAVTIPSTLDGHTVEAIADGVFWNCSSLTSVSIPDSVQLIGACAFADCSSLTNVSIPDSVSTIGTASFENCSSLTSVSIPDSVTTIADCAFRSCSSLTNVTIPNSVPTIGQASFENCSSLTSVSIPDSVKTIGLNAFAGCERLEKVMVGSGVTFIDSVAFAYCANLTRVAFWGNAPVIGWEIFLDSPAVTVYRLMAATGWGDSFSGRPVACDYEYTLQWSGCTITRYTGSDVNVAIPFKAEGYYTVRWIGGGAFQNCSNLTSVIVPGCVAQIQARAFKGCVSLESVTLCAPRSLELGMEAFAGCTGLTEVAFLGNAPQSVAADVFSGSPRVNVYCQPRGFGWETALADRPVVRLPFNYSVVPNGEATFFGFASSSGSLTVPNKAGRYPVTRIGGQAFQNATGLTSITFPETIASVGPGAFLGCSGLEEIVLPESVNAVESYAFAECTGVRRVVWGQGMKRVGVGAFSGCASLAGITLPAQVGCVEDQTFDQCSGLAGVVFDGTSVTNIAAGAFSGCKGLTNLAIPDSVAKIGPGAFSECVGLTGIVLPAAVTDIGDGAFFGCARLLAITVDAGNAKYSSQDGVLFTGDGSSLIRCPEGKTGPYIVPSGTVNIADGAFLDCYGLTRIDLPSSVSSLGASVFEGCASLSSFEVDAANAAYACQDGILFSRTLETLVRYPPDKAGTSYAVPGSVICIDEGAFEGCASLTNIAIPEMVGTIGEDVFEGCDALEAILVDENNGVYASQDGVLLTADRRNIIRCPLAKTGDYAAPSGIEYISGSAFSNCRRLTHITLPVSLAGIGLDEGFRDCSAFAGCSELTAIDVDPANGHFHSDNGVLMTGSTLLCCPGGKSGAYTIPADVTYIEADAFENCSRLTAINVAASDGPYSSDDGVLYDRSMTTLLQCPGGKTGHYAIPDSAHCIDVAAFLNCTSLSSVAIPASVTRIEPMAFFGCSALTSIAVDPANTFYSSQGGTLFDKTGNRLIQYAGGESDSSYTVPATVSSLGDYSFWGRSSLTSLYFKGDQPSGMGTGTFYGAHPSTFYYLPGSSGWDQPLNGVSLIAWDPRIQAEAGFGPSGNGLFGFTVSGTTGMRVAVEASTNLNAAAWESVGSMTLAPDGTAVFTDEAAADHKCRFYRLRMP